MIADFPNAFDGVGAGAPTCPPSATQLLAPPLFIEFEKGEGTPRFAAFRSVGALAVGAIKAESLIRSAVS